MINLLKKESQKSPVVIVVTKAWSIMEMMAYAVYVGNTRNMKRSLAVRISEIKQRVTVAFKALMGYSIMHRMAITGTLDLDADPRKKYFISSCTFQAPAEGGAFIKPITEAEYQDARKGILP